MRIPRIRALQAGITALGSGAATAVEVVVFLLPVGLICGLMGYLSDPLKQFLIYTLLLLPILSAASRRRILLLLCLAVGIWLNAVVTHNPVLQVTSLLLVHFVVWSHVGQRWLRYYPAIVVFMLLHIALFLSPLGYYPVEALAGWLSASFTRLFHVPCNLGFTYLNIGSALLFLLLSASLCCRGRAVLRTLCFALLLAGVTALLLEFVLYRLDLNRELLLTLKIYEYTSAREYIRFYGQTVTLLFPGILFLAHLCLFVIVHLPAVRHESTAAVTP